MIHNPIISPNTVLANSLLNTIDFIRPRIAYLKPKKIVFVVGTQINGAPHLGTNIVQTVAFLLANEARHRFSVDTSVKFGALDNAPKEIVNDPFSIKPYQITYFHKLGSEQIDKLIFIFYSDFINGLSDLTNIEYEIETYTKQQSQKNFREEFIKSLHRVEDIRWFISPSSGKTHIRIPCPKCKFAEKHSERTTLEELKDLVAGAAGPKVTAKNVTIAFSDSLDPYLASDKPSNLPKPDETGNPWWLAVAALIIGLGGGLKYISNKNKIAQEKQREELSQLQEKSYEQELQLRDVNLKAAELIERQAQMAQGLIEQQQREVIPNSTELNSAISELRSDLEGMDDDEAGEKIKNWIEKA